MRCGRAHAECQRPQAGPWAGLDTGSGSGWGVLGGLACLLAVLLVIHLSACQLPLHYCLPCCHAAMPRGVTWPKAGHAEVRRMSVGAGGCMHLKYCSNASDRQGLRRSRLLSAPDHAVGQRLACLGAASPASAHSSSTEPQQAQCVAADKCMQCLHVPWGRMAMWCRVLAVR